MLTVLGRPTNDSRVVKKFEGTEVRGAYVVGIISQQVWNSSPFSKLEDLLQLLVHWQQ